jgi:type II secretory pathway pseudopilin PulG
MTHPKAQSIPRRLKRSGIGLAELLISVAIMATLLAAVAAAMNATFTGYSENEKISSATQAARGVLNRLATDVRRCGDATVTATSVTLRFADFTQTKYELLNGTLFYYRTVNGVTTTYTLLGSGDRAQVTSFVVTRIAGTDAGGLACTTSVTVALTVAVDNRTLTVTTTADPRSNQLF